LFMKSNIRVFPTARKFLLLLLSFIVDKKEISQTNPGIQNRNLKHKYHFRIPNGNVSKYQRSVLYRNGVIQ
jgi:hypothetical protein